MTSQPLLVQSLLYLESLATKETNCNDVCTLFISKIPCMYAFHLIGFDAYIYNPLVFLPRHVFSCSTTGTQNNRWIRKFTLEADEDLNGLDKQISVRTN